MSQNDSNASESDPTLALILAGVGLFIPLLAGAGQIYNGDAAEGVLIIIFGPLYLIVVSYTWHDAYTTAQS